MIGQHIKPLKVLNATLDTVKRLFASQILVRTTGHVTSMSSSFHSALVLILIQENIVKLKKSLLILAMVINAVQLEFALQMAKHTHATVVTVVTLATCVTFLHAIILHVVTTDRAMFLVVLHLVNVTLDILVTNVKSVRVTPRIAVTMESAL